MGNTNLSKMYNVRQKAKANRKRFASKFKLGDLNNRTLSEKESKIPAKYAKMLV